MDADSPIEVIELADGKLYRLPRRQLGAWRWLVVGPIIPAVVVWGLLFNFFITRAAQGPLDELAWGLFVLVGLLWACGCYWVVSLSAAIWCGRAEIEVTDSGAVRALDRAGWFRVCWGRLKPNTARKLILTELLPTRDSTGQLKPASEQLWQLSAEIGRVRKVWLVFAYPREILSALAEVLAERLTLDPLEPDPAPIPVVVEEETLPSRDVLDPPTGTRVELKQHADGITLTVPPLGIFRGTGTLAVLGTFFTLVGGAVVVGMIERLLLQPNPQPPRGELVGIVFLLIGLIMVFISIQIGRKRVVLAVVGEQLLTFEAGPFRSKRRDWTRDDLFDIVCGPSGIKVNNRVLPQLQIFTGETSYVGMLTGRDETELKWIATVLRQALRLPRESADAIQANQPAPE
ncbi:MAG: hypothetical protein L0241_00580 [Planctomycetia bacterium]|nr:hypothetical protein [Planctomycetia bacterium]